MKTIKPNQDFKHGRKTYKKNRKYEVSPEDAEYFESVGWVGEQPASSAVHTLDVHDGALGQISEFSN